MSIREIEQILGEEGQSLLAHESKTIAKELLHLPGPDFVDRVWLDSDRSPVVLRNLQTLFDTGTAGRHRLPFDPPGRPGHRALGRRELRAQPALLRPREHRQARRSRAAATPSPRPSACSGPCARKYAHKIPFILKLNHNEFLSYPNSFDQILFASVKQAFDMGAVGVGATIYFGSEESKRQLQEVYRGLPARARARAVHRPLVLPAQPGLQDQGQGLPRLGRPHGAGQPPRRDDPGRHHQAEAAREQRRLQRARLEGQPLRQDRQADLHRADHRSPDRPHPLPGGQLLHGPRRPDQLRRRLVRRRATSAKPSRPPSSTSAPAAWG